MFSAIISFFSGLFDAAGNLFEFWKIKDVRAQQETIDKLKAELLECYAKKKAQKEEFIRQRDLLEFELNEKIAQLEEQANKKATPGARVIEG
jgi:hypothetical protein